MHQAFEVVPVVEDLPLKIEAVLAYSDRLYIGTSTGVLLVYEVRESTDEEPLSVTLIESKKNFSKKTIEQLEYIKEMDVLVSLSDNVVSMYDTQTLTLRPQLPKIKNAYLFAVSSSIEIEDGIPAIMTRLCVAVKKKLVIYSWEDMDLLDTKEFNVPDKVRKITWASSTKLCLSFTKGYVILDLSTGKLTELFVNAGEGTGLGSSLSELGSMAIGAMGMILNAGKPLIVRLPNDELLVEKDNVSIFISPDGTPTRKAGISWSAAPEELGYSFPYAIAILSKHVEIRNIGTQRLVQNIELMHAQMMTQGKVIYIASADHVWRLIPLDFMKQIDQLVESNEFEEALSLLDQI
ncbi:Vacuolar morphogenesis protein 6, partial [Basidiobolus ranarum]